MRVEKDFRDLLKLLNKKKVKYLVVGGFAFSFYAEPRFTKDIDIFVSNSDQNTTKLIDVIEAFGFKKSELSINDFKKKETIIQLGYVPVRIDLVTSISGVDFKSAWTRKVQGKYGDIEINFISLKDLIINKKSAARERDLLDLKYLEKIIINQQKKPKV